MAATPDYAVGMMSGQTEEVLKEIRSDLGFLKEKIILMEITINEIDSDVHRKLNPKYVKKLEKIEKEDRRIHFKNIGEFDKHLNGPQ